MAVNIDSKVVRTNRSDRHDAKLDSILTTEGAENTENSKKLRVLRVFVVKV